MLSNPLIRLEFLRRFRSATAAWTIPLVIGLPGLAVVIGYATIVSPNQRFDQFGNPIQDASTFTVADLEGVGIGMFVGVIAALVVALLLLVPSTVGGSIAGERQSQTLQPLQLTDMTPGQIVAGKLVSSLSFLVVLLACAAPVLAIPFLLGGTTAAQVAGSVLVLFLITVELAALSLAASAAMSRPTTGIVVSLLGSGALLIGPWVVMGLGFAAAARSVGFDADASALRYLASLSPLALGSWVVDAGNQDIDTIARTGDKLAATFWFVVVTAVSLWVAKVKVTAPVERDR
jgi:ABC-type Na+ efflux pump permease subunit